MERLAQSHARRQHWPIMPATGLELQTIAPLREAWHRLLGENAKTWWTKAQHAYSEPQRAYHTLLHLATMYDLYHTHRDALALASWLRVFVLAIVFHDIVYDPLSKTNELDSISSFRMFVSDACPSMGSEEIGLVEAMIEATIRHEMPASCNSDAARHVIGSFLDLDLAILSSTNDVYDEYTKQIRMEYIAYSEAEFQQGRAAVLKSFLHRDNLYFTRRFQDEWTAAARANIERELKNLTG